MRDIYHSVYLLRRTPGTPSCGEQERRRVIHDILASLMVQLQRQTQPATTGDVSPHAGEWLDWASRDLMKWLFRQLAIGCWRPPKPSKMTSKDSEVNKGEDHELIPKARVGVGLGLILGTSLELTPKLSPGPTLEVDLGISARANSQSCYHGDPQGICPWSPDGPLPRRRVSFHNPDDIRDPVKEEVSCLMEPSMDNLETWLEFQAGQLGTPTWWEELGAVPGIEDRHKICMED